MYLELIRGFWDHLAAKTPVKIDDEINRMTVHFEDGSCLKIERDGKVVRYSFEETPSGTWEKPSPDVAIVDQIAAGYPMND